MNHFNSVPLRPGSKKQIKRTTSKIAVAAFPRQHGAWSVLLASLALGAVAAGETGIEYVLFFVSAVFGFMGRYAIALYNQLPGSDERKTSALMLSLVYMGMAAFTSAILITVYKLWLLIPLILIMLSFLGVSIVFQQRRKERTVSGEITGLTGLSLVSLLAAYSVRGSVEPGMIGIWLLSLLFFVGSVFHVRFVAARCATDSRANLFYHLIALALAVFLAVAGYIPSLATVAMIPVTVKVVLAVKRNKGVRQPLRRIGYIELSHTVLFVVLCFVSVWLK